MNDTSKKKLSKELNEAANMKQFFEVLGKYYDLENCKPGAIVKGTMISKIPSIIMLVGAKPKREFQ